MIDATSVRLRGWHWLARHALCERRSDARRREEHRHPNHEDEDGQQKRRRGRRRRCCSARALAEGVAASCAFALVVSTSCRSASRSQHCAVGPTHAREHEPRQQNHAHHVETGEPRTSRQQQRKQHADVTTNPTIVASSKNGGVSAAASGIRTTPDMFAFALSHSPGVVKQAMHAAPLREEWLQPAHQPRRRRDKRDGEQHRASHRSAGADPSAVVTPTHSAGVVSRPGEPGSAPPRSPRSGADLQQHDGNRM